MTLPKSSPYALAPTPTPCKHCGSDRTEYEREAETPLQAQISFYEGTCPACTRKYWETIYAKGVFTPDAIDYLAGA
jgi:uncharacterized protein with PIN domain